MTLAPRNVFSATYTPPPKMITVPFAPTGRETLRGFFVKLRSRVSGSFSFVGLQPSRKRVRMAADWARVAVPRGSSVDSVTPVIMPSPQTHCIALIAYSLMDAKSL